MISSVVCYTREERERGEHGPDAMDLLGGPRPVTAETNKTRLQQTAGQCEGLPELLAGWTGEQEPYGNWGNTARTAAPVLWNQRAPIGGSLPVNTCSACRR